MMESVVETHWDELPEADTKSGNFRFSPISFPRIMRDWKLVVMVNMTATGIWIQKDENAFRCVTRFTSQVRVFSPREAERQAYIAIRRCLRREGVKVPPSILIIQVLATVQDSELIFPARVVKLERVGESWLYQSFSS